MKQKFKKIAILSVLVVILLIISSVIMSHNHSKQSATLTTNKTQKAFPKSYKIEGVPVIKQEELKAGCETYACTMLLQSQGIDMDEFEFANNYLVQKPIYENSEDDWYGPDMDSAL